MNNTPRWNFISSLGALIVGVILFYILGKDWLDLASLRVLLAGLAGVAVTVLIFSAWRIYKR